MHSCFCSPHPLWLITHTSFFGPLSFSSFFIRIAIKDRLLFLPFLTHRLLASRGIVYPENFPHQHFFCSSLQPAVLVPSCDTFHNTCLTSAGMTSGQTSARVWVLELFTAAPDFSSARHPHSLFLSPDRQHTAWCFGRSSQGDFIQVLDPEIPLEAGGRGDGEVWAGVFWDSLSFACIKGWPSWKCSLSFFFFFF